MTERTLCMIKPDGVERNLIGNVLTRIESAGLRIVALRKLRLTKAQAEGFYAVHKERPFFQSLVDYMTSGPIVAAVLEGENAIAVWRGLMGATNPANADAGTIRKDLALDVERNTVHGSDASETAAQEIPYFFNAMELQG
ncbi:nucleoside diphosphate kinase [Desulfonatronum thiosulfatophilum]|uniref:Nucleoside diphosphate kinase n=1 Tax=Desulfonatronum thiosulfatophilum TaxID=617002 RepID=A0A1G6DPA1_9BACT|nr:nucleoside-diphosphate kinase [Desulfonatronum thiosulfatophilum]SDB46968.1 nucleoside diphosphate kinase [Desulfonatronum thiosulfatophilum]